MDERIRPCWALRGGAIDEALFALEFLMGRKMVCYKGTFYTVEGAIRDESSLRREIYLEICDYVSSSIAKKITSLLEVLRLQTQVEQLPDSRDAIHLANGTFRIGQGFTPEKQICRYRLPVRYNEEAPEPERWLRFLEELLEPEDIYTLQEYLGYCLIPVTYGQKMLTLVGSGGEGKSRIGVVMKAILGDNMATGSLSKVEMNQFARADLENLLLLVDDDLKMEALKQTNYLKAIITADTPMDLERKGRQSYQGILHTRFLAFGNSTLQALHDRSNGFFRRQIILRAKPVPADRVDDPFLGDALVEEKEAIFLWALSGLYRLIGNNYRFTLSDSARDNLDRLIDQSLNIKAFLQSGGYIRFDPFGSASSRQLYECYCRWCSDNASTALSSRSFSGYLTENAAALGIRYSHNIDIGGGKTARGFRGLGLQP